MVVQRILCVAMVLICAPAWAKDKPAEPKSSPTTSPQTQAKDKPLAAKAKEPKKPKDKLALLDIEKNIIQQTNAERARYGLAPLKVDPELMKSARRHAIWMTRFRRLQHTRLGVAENIAMGYGNSLAVVRGWMNSSGHRANILNRSHQRIGVAAYVTDGGTIYWCQQFRR